MTRPLKLSLITLAALLPAAFWAFSVDAQNRGRFSHATPQHKKLNCAACHKIPTSNWRTTSGFPDVKDYPGHAACVSCHRQDFFRGNQPAFCGVCHSVVGPRGKARFPFPHPTRSSDFSTIFPHNVHQDVIAETHPGLEIRPLRQEPYAVAHFVLASYSPQLTDDPPPVFNNCAICHETVTKMPRTAPRVSPGLKPLADAAPENFEPKPGFFKDMPTGHASCFNCHYQGIKPAAADCAGCHALTQPSPRQSNVFRRYSIKFDHLQKEHSTRDCMTCHVRISQNSDLRTMKDADVPFITCVQCHNDKISEETAKRAESLANNQPPFQCVYCHSTAVGRFPMPASHEKR